MADVVDRAGRVVIQQTLHGYADGHRLLAGSTPVKPRDGKTMLALSDLPGPGTKVEESGYLTGYPLPDTGMYALARTWPAHEMPRPGCVWTHSILIDYADLATLADPSQLLRLLRRPSNGDFESYLTAIEVSPSGLASLHSEDQEQARYLLFALYENAKKPIIATTSGSVAAERLVLAVWAQQWPRLRRAFRFCTFTTTDRSGEGATFDLQFVPASERSARARFADAVDALREEPPRADWLEHALSDLAAPEVTGLREFLRLVAAEGTTGRESFRPLTSLHRLITEFDVRSASIDEAIALLERDASHSQSARVAVTTAALQAKTLGIDATKFVLAHLDDVGIDAPQHGDRLTRALWRHSPGTFFSLLDGSGSASAAAKNVLAALENDELMTAIKRAPEVLGPILQRRPDVVTTASFWRLDSVDRAGIDHLAKHASLLDAALDAIFAADRRDLAPAIARRFGTARIFARVAPLLDRSASETVPDALVEWLSVCVRETSSLATALSQVMFHGRRSLVALARMTQPDSVPNDYGDDPWWTSLQKANGGASSSGELYLSTFLLTRGLGYRSKSQAELISATFDVVYDAASRPDMPENIWRMLSGRLPSRWSIPDWDRCPRLRLAVVEAFVDRELWPTRFVQVTASDAVFAQLIELAADSYRGRRYLKRVHRDVSDTDAKTHRRRLEMLDRLLD
jgi:hypothetical protein